MLTPPQRRLLKMAQRDAALPDAEYREELVRIAGVNSSTASTWTEEQFDATMALFEAIYWRKVIQRLIVPNNSPRAVFRVRGYWASKNPRRNTSRDRYTASQLGELIQDAEAALAGHIGIGAQRYLEAIRARVVGGRSGLAAERDYLAAIQRTLAAKLRIANHANRAA